MNSILLDDLDQLKTSVKKVMSYQDINYNGLDSNDSVTVENENCLLQKMKIWLQSDINDYHRNPEMGGVVIDNARKLRLTQENAEVLKTIIRNESLRLFSNILISEISVVPNVRQRRWEIKIAVYNPKTKMADNSMFENSTSIAIYTK